MIFVFEMGVYVASLPHGARYFLLPEFFSALQHVLVVGGALFGIHHSCVAERVQFQ